MAQTFKKHFCSWLQADTIQIPLHEHERLDIFAFKRKTYQVNRLVKISRKMTICYFTCPVWQLGQHPVHPAVSDRFADQGGIEHTPLAAYSAFYF